MAIIQLSDRATIRVAGPDAEHFLQNILTVDLDRLEPGMVKPGALLAPQGKILFDFLISRDGQDAFLLECRAEIADDFLRRLTMYKLRAKAEISKQDQAIVVIRWDADSNASETDSTGFWLRDARFPETVRVERSYSAQVSPDAETAEWTRLRIAHGIAESDSDYALNDAFPHDVLLDELDGVGFRKGCYVGQEVVSRMQHRGTARRRVMIVDAQEPLPAAGTDIKANGRSIGTLGSVDGTRGLAIVRTDRVGSALADGMQIMADEVALSLSIPAWAKYTLPQADAED